LRFAAVAGGAAFIAPEEIEELDELDETVGAMAADELVPGGSVCPDV
jgi:hypothetical protein